MEQECRDGLTYPAMMAPVNDFFEESPWLVRVLVDGFRRQIATRRRTHQSAVATSPYSQSPSTTIS
jgi:hypothetical protein